jgi:hypothetical protein
MPDPQKPVNVVHSNEVQSSALPPSTLPQFLQKPQQPPMRNRHMTGDAVTKDETIPNND